MARLAQHPAILLCNPYTHTILLVSLPPTFYSLAILVAASLKQREGKGREGKGRDTSNIIGSLMIGAVLPCLLTRSNRHDFLFCKINAE